MAGRRRRGVYRRHRFPLRQSRIQRTHKRGGPLPVYCGLAVVELADSRFQLGQSGAIRQIHNAAGLRLANDVWCPHRCCLDPHCRRPAKLASVGTLPAPYAAIVGTNIQDRDFGLWAGYINSTLQIDDGWSVNFPRVMRNAPESHRIVCRTVVHVPAAKRPQYGHRRSASDFRKAVAD